MSHSVVQFIRILSVVLKSPGGDTDGTKCKLCKTFSFGISSNEQIAIHTRTDACILWAVYEFGQDALSMLYGGVKIISQVEQMKL